MEQLVARSAHNREVAGSSPVAAIHVRVQHHPSRAHLLSPLLGLLDSDVEIVTDPDPDAAIRSPWRTYRECLVDPPRGVTHLLVLQDDVVPCRNLVAACERIARPEPVVLWLGGAPVRIAHAAKQASLQGQRIVPVRLRGGDWLPVVAVLWPVEVAGRFIEWAGSNRLPGDPNPRSDDAVAGRWARKTGQEVWVAVPSLVEHGRGLSLIRRRSNRSPWRVAFEWIGDRDPLDIWTLDS